jgi:hypothetical protein
MIAQHYEWSEDGMEVVGDWGSFVHSDDYDNLLSEKDELQKSYDALVKKIGELYWMA